MDRRIGARAAARSDADIERRLKAGRVVAAGPPVLVVHNRVAPGAPPHEADVLVQADSVARALRALGHAVDCIDADLDLGRLQAAIGQRRPQLVFNLVESLGGADCLMPLVPALLEHMGQPFTGAPAEALVLSGNKLLAKVWLRAHGIATPERWSADAPPHEARGQWIVKSVTEHASLGLDAAAVAAGPAAVQARLAQSAARHGGEWFAERYVDGREFNVALLAGAQGPVVLPLAEIDFAGLPEDEPHVVGYRAKWHEDSVEAQLTPRRFIDERAEAALAAELRALATRCWVLFGLRGWARVDVRVDAAGRPWVLEVNANPCLAPDAGFAAALERAGVSFAQAIARILADAWRPGGRAHE